ncbi:MAG: hypothetical protein ACKVK1_01940 [Flavobacteriales bacterium]
MSDIYKTIIKNHSSGKGMTMGMKIITDKDGEHIHMHNTYFGGGVYQVYSKKTDTTNIRVQMQMMYSPIWLLEKMGPVGSSSTSRTFDIQNEDITLTFTGYSGNLTKNIDKKGIAFNGNIENIELINSLKHQLNQARDIIKHNSIETIVDCETALHPYVVSSYVTSVLHVLNYDQFFRLKWK